MRSGARFVPLIAALMMLGTLACSRSPMAPVTEVSPRLKFVVDAYRAISSDGRQLAFNRVLDGEGTPAGIYLMSLGKPGMRLLWRAPFGDGPNDLSFTPDGAYLIAEHGNQILVIDALTGASYQPFYTHNGAASPDAGPSGHQFLYSRRFLTYGDPDDSAGIRIFDLATRKESTLRDGGAILNGAQAKWAPDKKSFAFMQNGWTSLRIYDLQQGVSREILHAPSGQQFDSIRWFTHPQSGRVGILYAFIDPARTTRFIDVESGRDESWPVSLLKYDLSIPHSNRLLLSRECSTPHYATLFTQDALDPTGATAIQLTDWMPPR